MKLSKRKIAAFQKTIWEYYQKHGRKFPWRPPSSARGGLRTGKRDLDPYRVLVSEVMLQQTQADRVVPKYLRWMKEFPTITALARAPLKEMLRVWLGLGYNRRALHLKRAAEILVREYGGEVPRDREKLDALPGIGRATASAVLAFAWNQPTVFIETNIRTVYLHFFFKNKKKVRDEEILELVEQTLPNKVRPRSDLFTDSRSDLKKGEPYPVREWYDALMDYGTMLKKTHGNPNIRSAHYTRQKKFAGSRRELRGKIMRYLANKEQASLWDIRRAVNPTNHNLSAILNALVREGFLRKDRRSYPLA